MIFDVKMGYRGLGFGLGRAEQGMSSALRIEKTGKNAGVIVVEDVAEKAEISIETKSASNADLLADASKIVLLKVCLLLSSG